jgi:hypothetical protein
LVPPLLIGLPLAACSYWLMPGHLNRWFSLFWIAATGLVLVCAIVGIGFGRSSKVIQPA